LTLGAEDQPLRVDVLNGEVVMTGPRVAIALLPSAAMETAKRLSEAAQRATGLHAPIEVSAITETACNDV
jgi:hypothetical protein